MRFVRSNAVGLVLVHAMFFLAVARTQSSAQIPTLLRGGTMGEVFAIYVPRGESAIENSLNFARSLSKEASNDLLDAQRREIDGKGRLKILVEELKTSKTRRDVAKKTKDESQRRDFVDAVKQQEQERKYLEQMSQTLETNRERLESDRAAGDAYVKALEMELDVARKHSQLNISVSQPTSLEISAYTDMLRKMLDAQRTAADQWVSAGELRKQVAERQLRQLQTLNKLSSGK
jgi:hypothetical protein